MVIAGSRCPGSHPRSPRNAEGLGFAIVSTHRERPRVYSQLPKRGPAKPEPPLALPERIWPRIEALTAAEPNKEEPNADAEEPSKRKRGVARKRARRRRRMRLLDTLGVLVWVFVIFKLTTGDLDREVMSSRVPSALWVIDAPWLLLLFFVAAVLLMAKAHTAALVVLYVAGFPLVVLFWKVPRRFTKYRNSISLVAVASSVLNVVGRAKPFVLSFAGGALAGVFIFVGTNKWLIGAGASMMLCILLWSLTTSVADLLRTAPFLRAQERAIAWILRTQAVRRFTTPDIPNQLELANWKLEDAKKYRDAAGFNLLADQAIRWWEKLLTDSRRGPWVTLSSIVLFVVMITQVVAAFTLINYAVFRIAPGQFSANPTPDGFTFTYYSFVGSYFSEIGALTPHGPLAIAAKIANGFVGSIGVLTIVVSLIVAYRNSSTDAGLAEAVKTLANERASIEKDAEGNFLLSYGEIEEHLVTTRWDMAGAFHWMAGKTMPLSPQAD